MTQHRPLYCCTEGNTDIYPSATFKLPAIFVTLLQFVNSPLCVPAHNLIQVSGCSSQYVPLSYLHNLHFKNSSSTSGTWKREETKIRMRKRKEQARVWFLVDVTAAVNLPCHHSLFSQEGYFGVQTQKDTKWTEIKSNGCLKARPAALCNAQLQSSTSYNNIQLV